MLKLRKIRSYEKGLLFEDNEFKGFLDKGRYWFLDPFFKVKVDVVSTRTPWLFHENLEVMVKSGGLEGQAQVIDLADYQRALVWVDGRFDTILGPGLYALWEGFSKTRVEIIDAREVRLTHVAVNQIAQSDDASEFITVVDVPEERRCVYFRDGKYQETLAPGRYLFWRDIAVTRFYTVDQREQIIDVSGQEIMTADKVTLRMNSVLAFCVTDALKSVTLVGDLNQALYREAQLALRTVIGSLELDAVLNGKEDIATELRSIIRKKADDFGIRVKSFGIRDVILPGDMKDLMNKVIAARKAAESNLIMRREETAAMRSQANTARLLDSNPTLMRLRELDILEKLVSNSNMSLVLGEKGLSERVANLL